MRFLVKVMMGGPWRNAVWMGMHGTLFPLRTPEDHDEHRESMRSNLKEAGRSAALGQMMAVNHAYAEARYSEVLAESLFVMGTADSDFPDPVREATEVSEALGGSKILIEGAGHYPHVEAPEKFLAAVLPFLAGTPQTRKSA
jgi:pimeloyl-ACP methyl ester carboxylesterase